MGGGQLLVLERRRTMMSCWFGHREVRQARGGEGGGFVGLSVLNIYIYIYIKLIHYYVCGWFWGGQG